MKYVLYGGLALLGLLAALLIMGGPEDPRIQSVGESLVRQGSGEAFSLAMVEDLPEPAARYLLHAIRPGTPLARTVRLQMGGGIKLKPTADPIDMRAEEILTFPEGYYWNARIGGVVFWLTGFDLFHGETGKMEWLLWGRLPLIRSEGSEIARSSVGRLVAETVWLPSALLPQRGARWEGLDADRAKVVLQVGAEEASLELTVGPQGNLVRVYTTRWGDRTEDGKFRDIPFGADILAEGSFGGYTIPTELVVGWWIGTDRFDEFFRPSVEQAEFL